MKVTALMIGDWVCENSIPHQIYELGTTFCTNRKIHLLFTDSLQPVLLTEEILVANGFTKNLTPNEYELDHNTYSIYYNTKHSLMVVECYEKTLLDLFVSNVHELQHALRLCGLTDLADNFKI